MTAMQCNKRNSVACSIR